MDLLMKLAAHGRSVSLDWQWTRWLLTGSTKESAMLSLHKGVVAAVILLTVCAVSSASAKPPAGSDSAPPRFKVIWKESRLSVTAERASLSQVLAEIAKQTGLEIRGGQALKREVSASFSRVSLREGLHELLGTMMNYALLEKDRSEERGLVTPFALVLLPPGFTTSFQVQTINSATQQGVNGAAPVMLPPPLPAQGVKLETKRPAPAMLPDEGVVIGSSRSAPLPLPDQGVNLELFPSQGGGANRTGPN
jgi:hypothetical protein